MAATEDRLNENLRQVADGIRGARGTAARPYLLVVHGDVEPELLGPYSGDLDRKEAAQDYRRAHGDEDGLYRVDATGDRVTVGTFTGRELEPPRISWVSAAWINGRNATVHSDGWYQMHAYDTDPEDDVPKRVGAAEFTHYSDALRAGERWTRDRVWDMRRARQVLETTPIVEDDDDGWQCPACYPEPCMHGQGMQDGGYC